MPNYLCRQPNGLFAVFSTVVDNFTVLDMTEQEALEHYQQEAGNDVAVNKVREGIEDKQLPFSDCIYGDGLGRWRESIETMEEVNSDGLAEFRRDYQEVFIVKGGS